MARPNLHRIVVEAKDTAKALKDLQQHQDRVRLSVNDRRTKLEPLDKASEPSVGELLLNDGKVYVALANGSKVEYKQIYPADISATGIPDWFIKRLAVFEELLRAAGIPEEEWPYHGGL